MRSPPPCRHAAVSQGAEQRRCDEARATDQARDAEVVCVRKARFGINWPGKGAIWWWQWLLQQHSEAQVNAEPPGALQELLLGDERHVR